GQSMKLVDRIVRVHGLIAVEPEARPMKIVGSRLRYGVDDAPAGTTEFSRVGIGIDLKFSYRILADVIRLAAVGAKTRSPNRLPPERVIVIDSIEQQRVHGALAGEAETAPHIPCHSRRQKHERREIPPVDRQVRNETIIDGCAELAPTLLQDRRFI